MGEPSIAVVVPCRNGADYLGEALESVLAQGRTLEVMVVDDGSTDDSARVAGAFAPRVRCVRQQPSGVGAARNRGVAETRAELLAFLDADDVWPKGRFEPLLGRLLQDTGLEAVFGRIEEFICPSLPPSEAARLRPRPTAGAPLAGGMLLRRSALERVGAFPVGWRVGEFVAWYMHAREQGLVEAAIDEVVLLRRLHASNLGRQDAAARADYVRILKQALDRRRARNLPGARANRTQRD